MKIKKSMFWDNEQSTTELSFVSYDEDNKEKNTKVDLTEGDVIDLREIIGISDSIKFKDVSVCVYDNDGKIIGDVFNFLNYKWNKDENKYYVYLGRMQLDSSFAKGAKPRSKPSYKIIIKIKHPKLPGNGHFYNVNDSETQSYEFLGCGLYSIDVDFDVKKERYFGEELLCFECEKLDIKKIEEKI